MSQVAAAGEREAVRARGVTTVEGVAGLAAEWERLWQCCRGSRTPFLSLEWAWVWLRHHGAAHPPHVIVVESGGCVIGIVPFMLTAYRLGRFGFQVLETLGGQSRNLMALVAPGRTREVADAVATYFRDAFPGRRLRLRLGLVPQGTPFLGELMEALAARVPGIALSCRPVSRAPYAPLPAVWDDYLHSLGRRRRKVLGRGQRGLDHAFRSQEFRWLHGEDVEPAMRELFRLHEARWTSAGIRGLFSSEVSRRFHIDVAQEFDRRGWLDLSTMSLDGRTVSAHFAIVLDGCAYLLRSGRDPSLAEYSIGHLHDLRLFRSWVGAGLFEADFLRGSEPYKFYWTKNARTYVELIAAGGGRWGALRVHLLRLWMWFTRFAAARHTPRELFAYLALRRREKRERRVMGVD